MQSVHLTSPRLVLVWKSFKKIFKRNSVVLEGALVHEARGCVHGCQQGHRGAAIGSWQVLSSVTVSGCC